MARKSRPVRVRPVKGRFAALVWDALQTRVIEVHGPGPVAVYLSCAADFELYLAIASFSGRCCA